jgi:uncharacterized protein (UPF0262 family)
MIEYRNLKTVYFDVETIKDVHFETSHECLLIASYVSRDCCLYPLSYTSIPYLTLLIGFENSKLKLEFTDETGLKTCFILSLSPYIRFIREYKDICNSYKQAISHDTVASIETIDMARRGLHNQAADLIKDRLRDKINGNHDAFRYLFSLIVLLVNTK